MNFKAILAGAFVMVAACATPAAAWTQIGVREVRDRTDRDVIHANGPRQFERIKLCVYRNPVHFYDLDVFSGMAATRTSPSAPASTRANARARSI